MGEKGNIGESLRVSPTLPPLSIHIFCGPQQFRVARTRKGGNKIRKFHFLVDFFVLFRRLCPKN